ncbi:MAG: ribosome small subunit-dependent GTPase A [Gallionellaceae bacterium]|nr:ribosome small subunit-dependent GTPase A [Gallionellaceae bacterium]
MTGRLAGRIVAVHGRHFLVEAADGRYDCVTRGKKGGLACGDRVEIKLTSLDAGVIEKNLPRDNLLYRSDSFHTKLLAANVDQVFIVTAAVPTPDPGLLDRCLVASEAAGIPARIVVNKTDLPETAAWLDKLAPYEAMGYPLIHLAAKQDIAPLAAWLAEKTSILVGASGVGKSTLINSLVPEAEIATREVSEALDTGKHTTTNTRLYHLPGGGALIDSPGMQEFALGHLNQDDLQAAFPEFRPLIGQCRFYNCRHLKEPNCAILAAVEDGRIQRRRWRCYETLCRELDGAAKHY